MVEKSTEEKILEHFFLHPTKEFHMRQLSRILDYSLPTILRTIEKLKDQGLITITEERPLKRAKANLNQSFVRKKMISNLEQIYECGLVDELDKKSKPQAIILFGSYSRGEDTERSDIDIAIIAGEEKELDLSPYEKLLKRDVSLHYLNRKPTGHLAENLKNGIVLEGAM